MDRIRTQSTQSVIKEEYSILFFSKGALTLISPSPYTFPPSDLVSAQSPPNHNFFRRELDFAGEVLQLDSVDDFPWSGGFGGPAAISRKSLLGTARVVMLAKARKRADGQFRRSLRCGAAGRMATRPGVRGPSSR